MLPRRFHFYATATGREQKMSKHDDTKMLCKVCFAGTSMRNCGPRQCIRNMQLHHARRKCDQPTTCMCTYAQLMHARTHLLASLSPEHSVVSTLLPSCHATPCHATAAVQLILPKGPLHGHEEASGTSLTVSPVS